MSAIPDKPLDCGDGTDGDGNRVSIAALSFHYKATYYELLDLMFSGRLHPADACALITGLDPHVYLAECIRRFAVPLNEALSKLTALLLASKDS